MKWLLPVFGLLGVWHSVVGENYENHTLVRLYPYNLQELEIVRHYDDPGVDILKKSRDFNDSTDILVSAEKLPGLEKYAKENHLHLEIKQYHYGRNFDTPDRTPKRRVFRSNSVFSYNSYNVINNMMENLAKQYPHRITVHSVGKSYEGRPINVARISSNPAAKNPTIFIDAGMHAREWVAPAMAMYLMNRLVTDPSSKDETNGIDWLILPLANPDGYEFSRVRPANRLWRKTVSQHTNQPGCFGVDGNRNYGFKWAVSGVSSNPCDKETYPGPQPFSESEAKAVKTVMFENKDQIKLYVSLHSYGQYLVYPWGYTGDHLPKQWKKLDRLARVVSAAVKGAGGPSFRVMSAGKWYPAAGGSDDYAFGAVGIPYSYTMELTDGYEFVYPESLLRSTLPVFYAGFKAFAREIRDEFKKRH